MLSPTPFYRTAGVLSGLFTFGHLYAFLRFRPPTAEAVAVRAAMDTTRFQLGSHWYSFGGLYVGAGLYVASSMVLVAAFAFWLGQRARKDPASVRAPTVFLLLFELWGVGLAWRFFPAAPLIFSALIALCLIVALIAAESLARRALSASPSLGEAV